MIDRSELFSTSIEAGLRSLGLLESVFPTTMDITKLVALDHIVVHSRDFDHEAPESLHPPSPYRRAEPVVRRDLIRMGLDLMVARNLIHRIPTAEGFVYLASESASPFLSTLQSEYWLGSGPINFKASVAAANQIQGHGRRACHVQSLLAQRSAA